MPRRALILLALLLAALPGRLAAGPQDALQWRVEGGEEALEPTARVRLTVVNRLPAEAVDPFLGLVQTAVYLYAEGGEAAALLAAAAERPGLPQVLADPALPGGGSRVSVQVPGVEDEDVALALVVGRDVQVVSVAADGEQGVTALRAASGDLADRLRWSTETLIVAGQERHVWEGSIDLNVTRIYADFLAVRAARVTNTLVAGYEANPADWQAGGILRISPTATQNPGVDPPVTRGTVLAGAASGRRQAVTLERGMLNAIRITAEQGPTGDFVIQISSQVLPLRLPAER